MHPSDPFPIENCSQRLRKAILAEFRGRSPTLEEVISIPPKQWLKVPGMGETMLMELEAIMRSQLDHTTGPASGQVTDAELIARLERLQRDLKRLRRDLLVRMSDPQPRADSPDSTDLH
jgi:hypothetical protein